LFLRIQVITMVGFVVLPLAAETARVEYIGGTLARVAGGTQGAIELADERYFAFYAKKLQLRIPYDRINLVEYGQQVDRRLALVVISPAFLLSKARKHFLTIDYAGDDGKQQALVFRVDKNGIRAALVGLEARTGKQIQYQDEEARKAGK
jgi:hypothetical protein